MANEEVQEERTVDQGEEMREETFHKDLYLYMKKRDTPIERIPHLGFKQIDLFVMYKTVRSLGGYHQVTSQQLWKQVYNALGGNPRSTSAATCTRRHYEKLLLPYECHVKGRDYRELLPPRQSKRFHYNSLCEEDDCPRTPKRSMNYRPHLHQNYMIDSHVRIIPMPAQYGQYYHPAQPMLPPYVPMLHPNGHPVPHPAPQTVPQAVPHPQGSYPSPPAPQGPAERVKQPLERLRYLADKYKSSSGWAAEPLNLSCKSSGPESSGHLASSFTPPSSNKAPKFLNKASPLYPTQGLVKEEGCGSPEREAAPPHHPAKPCSALPLYPYPPPLAAAARGGYVIDLTSAEASDGPASSAVAAAAIPVTDPADRATPPLGRGPRAPAQPSPHTPRPYKTEHLDLRRQGGGGGEQSPKPAPPPGPLNLSRVLPHAGGGGGSPPRFGGGDPGRMEIEIPLVLIQEWIKRGKLRPGGNPSSQSSAGGPVSPPALESREQARARSAHLHSRGYPAEVPQDRSSAIGYLTPGERGLDRHGHMQSPTTSDQHPSVPYLFSGFKPPPSRGVLQDTPPSRDAYSWEEQEPRRPSYHPINAMHSLDPQDRGSGQAQPLPLNIHSHPRALEQDSLGPTSPVYSTSAGPGRVDRSGMGGGPAVVMVNPPPAPSLGSLTLEEFMKLKRLISSS